MRIASLLGIVVLGGLSSYQGVTPAPATQLREKGLREMGAFRLLTELTTKVGSRLSGSENAAKAVVWGQKTMTELGFQRVRLVPCMAPHWVRGKPEKLTMTAGRKGETSLRCCALGGSVGTSASGLTGEVIEVKSLAEVASLGERARGKIVFLNGPMDPTLENTFAAYGGAVGQRVNGASAAAKLGALGVLVRSMTMDPDDEPHTGTLSYENGVAKIPAAAVSIVAANKLSDAVSRGPVSVRLTMNCETLPDVPSSSVVGELTGSEHPEEVIVVGGHLDSWDRGTGAHDDGSGVTQSLEALRLIKELGWKPKRTIRVVLFMDEEQHGRGAEAYAAQAGAPEKPIAGIESDSGGFAPRSFSTSYTAEQVAARESWKSALATFGIMTLGSGGGGGADVGPLAPLGAKLFGLQPESQRYFDYHHSNKDTLDKVNRRELELGALSMAMLAWLLSEEGA